MLPSSQVSHSGYPVDTLAQREKFRDEYGLRKDPIHEDRLRWRAQTFRHIVHLLPGQTILELGAGRGLFTRQLERASRRENPITAITFLPDLDQTAPSGPMIERFSVLRLPGLLEGRSFDHIVTIDLLDQRDCYWLLQMAYRLLKPGGNIVFYESNPWNVVLNLRRAFSRFFGIQDPRKLLNRPRIYELLSEIGFTKILAVYNDFVYAPLNRHMVWIFRNLSILLENMPGVRTLAGSILVHAQKPAEESSQPVTSLCEHECLRRAVSVVIPCHNEETNVQPLVSRLLGLYGDYLHEVILVDDNSRDSTASVIQSLAAQNPIVKPVIRCPPNGVGRALVDGYRAATGRYVLSLDCDFMHLLPEIRDLFDAAAKGCDVAVGSRFSRHSVLLNYPFLKIVANRGFHALAQIAFHRRFRDLSNNLKLLRLEVVRSLKLTEPGFAANAETGFQPLLMGFSIREIPISWINRTVDMGMSSFNLAAVGGGYWRVLFRLALQTRFGFRRLARHHLC